MREEKVFLAADLGAGSGRVIAGVFDGKLLRLEEVSRFESEPVELRGSIYWNITGLYQNVRDGLRAGLARYGDAVVSAGVDTWGVDYGLIDSHGSLVGLPYAYRDTRTNGMIAQAEASLGRERIYGQTGIQTLFFNTIYQLLAEKQQRPEVLQSADSLLFIPDLLNYWLTGTRAVERTIASTSQLYDPTRKDWAWDLIDGLQLPRRIFGELVDPGAQLGHALINERKLDIVAVCAHDTASAVLGAPLRRQDAAYLSSGTWSLLGVERSEPILSVGAREHNFTNEVGMGHSIRFLKNISGLWLIQECKRHWDRKGQEASYEALALEASAAEPFTAFIDPDDAAFVAPGQMPSRLREYLKRTGQPVPESRAGLLRIVFESLALKYRYVMEVLEELVGHSLHEVNVVGGGCRNQLLNQLAANALKRTVHAGPTEATAIGNILCQMMADGSVSSIGEGRELIRASFETPAFLPRDGAAWDAAYARYRELLDKSRNV